MTVKVQPKIVKKLHRHARYRPHTYVESAFDARCQCGQTPNHRSHQPRWWRWLFYNVEWRR